MSNTKEVSVSVDLEELERQLQEKREEEDFSETKSFNTRSTVFTLGSDPRLTTKRQIAAPDFYLVEILKDRLDNPYLQLNWRVDRVDVDSGGIVGFNIYRRRLSDIDESSFKGTLPFSVAAFDRLSVGNKRYGKFSFDRKALYNIKRGSIPLEILNSNLSTLRNVEALKLFSSPDEEISLEDSFQRFFARIQFEKVAYVDYTAFVAEERKKFLFVQDRNVVSLSYKDKKVGYSETFEYYIECITKNLGENPRSDTVTVTTEDNDAVRPPSSLKLKQLNEREIQLVISIDPREKIAQVIVYRRSDDEISFDKLITVANTNNCINVIDGSVQYTKSYIYRVFLQNIHGLLSEPKEIKVFSTTQKVTPQSRSVNLKIPIISAVQDQNSDYVRITISPNDPLISFYELQRRDLSIYEKRFAVPSPLETNYGAPGWPANTFFVQKERQPIIQTSKEKTSALKTKMTFKEIVFVDDTISKDHIYQYRTRGYDLFGNPSSYAFSTVRTTGKKSLRTPVNIKAETLRGFPFRLKLLWDDDNLSTLRTTEELFSGSSSVDKVENKILYKVQRRKIGETTYESFPATANKFIIDEVSSVDAVTFEGKLIDDTYVRLPNASQDDENLKIKDNIRRAFKLPNFLKENDIYFYRITAISKDGEESNASSEFQISTLADLSDPIDFRATVLNSKVSPVMVQLTWELDTLKSVPDYWTIERKIDSKNDSFSTIGKAYLESQFFDRNLKLGNTYLYRIKAFDVVGRESGYFEARLTL